MKRKALIIAALLLAASSAVDQALAFPKPADWGNNEWYQFFECAVTTVAGETPGHFAKQFGGVAATPVVDVYSALSGAGAAVKPALITWLKQKEVEAELNNDLERLNRYQAFETALATGDDARLKSLLAEYEVKRRTLMGAQQGGVSTNVTAPSKPTTTVAVDDKIWRKMVDRWRNVQSGTEIRIYFGDGEELVAACEKVSPTSKFAVNNGDLIFTHAFASGDNKVHSTRGSAFSEKLDNLKPYDKCKVDVTISSDGKALTLVQETPKYSPSKKEWRPDVMITVTEHFARAGD